MCVCVCISTLIRNMYEKIINRTNLHNTYVCVCVCVHVCVCVCVHVCVCVSVYTIRYQISLAHNLQSKHSMRAESTHEHSNYYKGVH